MMTDTKQRFRILAIFCLYYVVAVIVWGAMVRATGSGAGCGAHWPTCNGTVIPFEPSIKTMIEYSHRLTSGLSLVFVLVLWIFARQIFLKNHPARVAAFRSFVFIIIEALIGALLVLAGLVEENKSVWRAVVIALHLVNTFILLYWLARAVAANDFDGIDHSDELVPNSLAVAKKSQLVQSMILFVIVGATGAIVALGDTLFPAESLIAGFKEKFSPTAHFLVKLRIYHPILAIVTTIVLGLAIKNMWKKCFSYKSFHDDMRIILILLIVQVAGGFLNWVLLAPVWMQFVHLLLADILWIRLSYHFVKIDLFSSLFESKFNPKEAV
jgi:cytochrome c oxidase assembly protein subunit 15